MTWPVDPALGPHRAPLQVGALVEYVGPGTAPDTGIVDDVVRQAYADDLYVVNWHHHPGDRDLYHPAVLKELAR